MSQATLRVQKISGHAGGVPGKDTQREYTVSKLIDTTTCIGCKACEVACMEWNDLPFGQTVFDNTYQTMPETRWNYWNLILFKEHEREGGRETARRPFELPACRRVRSSWRGRHRGHLRFARRLKPGDLRRVAQKSASPLVREIVERSAEVARQRGYDRRTHRIVRVLFALRA